MNKTGALILFAKTPRAGRVKTRMHTHLNPAQACDLYKALLRDTYDAVSGTSGLDLWLSIAPESLDIEVLKKVIPFERYFLQDGHDLGMRMNHAFQTVCDHGYRKTVLVGCDIAALAASHITCATENLTDYDCVLGPSEDGGYYLIGLRQPNHSLFENISWSTSKVLEQTLNRASELKLSTKTIDKLYDIDTYGSLMRYYDRLQQDETNGRLNAQNTFNFLKSLEIA